MNTYHKFAPNVWLAKCTEPHEKGEIIPVANKYGKENDSIVFNLVAQQNGFYYYSIVRADGMNAQEYAKKRALSLLNAGSNAEKKSEAYWQASNEGRDFLALGEPIKVGHHSERRHRALIERNHNRMNKAVELADKAKEYEYRAEYWKDKAKDINLSMPESLEYYKFLLEGAVKKHADYKSGKVKQEHSFSMTYAKKEVNEIEKKIKLARQLWG